MIRHTENLGFVRNCNLASTHCTGGYLCFLNSDTIVQYDWLDILFETLITRKAGVVGPAFISPEKVLMECGSIVYSDGHTDPLGRLEPFDHRFQFINEVDFISGACILLSTELFQRVGKFDELFSPGYYEDVDLCFKISQLGYPVLVVPDVRVIHHVGSSLPLSERQAISELNRKKFAGRWKERLETSNPDHSIRHSKLRVWKYKGTIVIHYRTLKEAKDSASQRCLRLLHGLRRRGWHPVLAYHQVSSQQMLKELNQSGIETIKLLGPTSRALKKMLLDYHPTAALFSFSHTERHHTAFYRKHSPDTLRIFDTVDLAFIRKAREKAFSMGFRGTLDAGPATLDEEAYEEHISMARCDGVLTISKEEQDILTGKFHVPQSRVATVTSFHDADEKINDWANRSGYVYLGHFGFKANVDAVRWLAREIWPVIRNQQSDASLRICGSYAPEEIKALHNPQQGITVLGFVPDHLQAIRESRLMIAPLVYGAGVKGKINEALSTGTPVVTTTIGSEGIDEAGNVLIVKDQAADFAKAAVSLHENKDDWQHRSNAGLKLIKDQFGEEANMMRLEHFIATLHQTRTEPDVWTMASRMVWRIHDDFERQVAQSYILNLEKFFRRIFGKWQKKKR